MNSCVLDVTHRSTPPACEKSKPIRIDEAMNTRTWNLLVKGLCILAICMFAPAELRCDETFGDRLWSRDYLTGDWGGGRNDLSAKGIDFSFGYTGEVMSNRSGGMDIGSVYNGLGEFGVDLDLQKLTPGWNAGSFRINSIWLHGRSPSEYYTGDVMALSNIDGHDSIRLFEVWWMQRFFEQRLTLQAGNMLVDEDFTVNDMGGLFLNSAFGWPQFITANSGTVVPAFFASAPGIRLGFEPNSKWMAQAGIYDADSFDSSTGDPEINERGTHIEVSGDQGYFIAYEAGYRLNQSEGDSGLPGTYKLGGWYHTGDFDDLYRDINGNVSIVTGIAPRVHDGNYGFYASAEQLVWCESAGSDQGLGLFGRLGFGPQDRSEYDWVVDGGFNYTGLISSRDEDVFGVGVIWANVSDDMRRQQRADRDINGTAIPAISDHEIAIEATYYADINPWWSIQPSVQYIIHPGGSSELPNAFVIGLRSSLTF